MNETCVVCCIVYVLCMFIIPIIPMVMCGVMKLVLCHGEYSGVMKLVLCHGEYSLLKYLHIES